VKRASRRDALSLGINRHVFYGWVMLAVGGLAVFASGPGQSHIFSVYITPISNDLGISRTSIASAYAAATLLAAFGLPFVGRLIDRVGVRRVALGVAVAFGFANIAFGRIAGLLSLALAFGALRFLGQGSLMLSSNYLVSQWFNRSSNPCAPKKVAARSMSLELKYSPGIPQPPALSIRSVSLELPLRGVKKIT
jgi:MFS family permease